MARLYVLAARVRIHPVTLSRLLNGKRALRPDVVDRILKALLFPEKRGTR